MDTIIDSLNSEQLKDKVPEFDIGDTVRVSIKIIEGQKERIQAFQGTVIARKGRGLSETFSVHRVSYGEGMERVFYLHSPRVISIEVIKKGDVRRSKLYHLRGKTGKAAKVKEKIGAQRKSKSRKADQKPPVEETLEPETPIDIEEIATESATQEEPAESGASQE